MYSSPSHTALRYKTTRLGKQKRGFMCRSFSAAPFLAVSLPTDAIAPPPVPPSLQVGLKKKLKIYCN